MKGKSVPFGEQSVLFFTKQDFFRQAIKPRGFLFVKKAFLLNQGNNTIYK